MSRPRYTSRVIVDAFTQKASTAYDLHVGTTFDGTRGFEGWEKPRIPAKFSIGLIIGPSGTGKTLMLREYFNYREEGTPKWDSNKAIVSHFTIPEDAIDRLSAVGLNSVPSWLSPYHVLSNGEKFRADLARQLQNNAAIDEFTSVVDRNVAKSTCNSVHRYIKQKALTGVVLVSCHYDILNWLRPDWYFDTSDGTLYDGRSLQRPSIKIRVYPCARTAWNMFRQHHYYSQKLSAVRTFIATVEFETDQEIPVGFVASRRMYGRFGKDPRACWQAARTVVLPDFQGMGIGPRISDLVAQLHIDEGKRYFSKTTSVHLGGWRDAPFSNWRPTSKYDPTKDRFKRRERLRHQVRNGQGKRLGGYFSHEYIGAKTTSLSLPSPCEQPEFDGTWDPKRAEQLQGAPSAPSGEGQFEPAVPLQNSMLRSEEAAA